MTTNKKNPKTKEFTLEESEEIRGLLASFRAENEFQFKKTILHLREAKSFNFYCIAINSFFAFVGKNNKKISQKLLPTHDNFKYNRDYLLFLICSLPSK